MFKTFAFAATALTLASGSAFAAPSDDARTHFQAIASGDTQIVMRAYADQAQLNWVGGPLDGTYATTDAIRGTWEKFGKAVGPLKLTVGQIEESANPKGATVSANVVFEGKMKGIAVGTSVMKLTTSRIVVDTNVKRPGSNAEIKSHLELKK